jgi:sensor histidine kinase YesM
MNKKAKGNRKTFKETVRQTFIGYALIPFAILMLSVFLIIIILVHIAVRYNGNQNVKSVSSRIQSVVDDYSTYCRQLSTDETFIAAMNQESLRSETYERIYQFTNKQPVGCNFFVFDKDVNIVMGNTMTVPVYVIAKDSVQWGFFRQLSENPGQIIIAINRNINSYSGRSVISIGKAIVKNSEIVGFLSFDLLELEVLSILEDTSLSDIVLTDRYGYVAVTTNETLLDTFSKLIRDYRVAENYSTIGGRHFYLANKDILNGILVIYSITPMTFFDLAVGVLGVMCIIFLASFIIIFYVISGKVSTRTTKSLYEVVGAIKNVQEGDLDTFWEVEDVEDIEEFQVISKAYNKMIVEIKRLIELNKEEAIQTTQMEIKVLQQQFNPHFLFNTLETIRCLVNIEPKAATDDIVKLSALLRYSINNFPPKVYLKQDLEQIERYLEIIKRRFGGRLKYFIVTEDYAADVITPKMIIQPLIENSVNYGFRGQSKLCIDISAKIEEELLVITVKDDGSGIEAERLKLIEEMLHGTQNSSNAIGLFNVHRRIQLMYGKEYGITIQSEEGKGTVICAKFPVWRDDV